MIIYSNKTIGKLLLFLFAVLIGMSSLIYTSNIVNKLKKEERENVQLWAEAERLIIMSESDENLEFPTLFIENNNTVPVILTDESDSIISYMNFDSGRMKDQNYLKRTLRKIKEKNKPIMIKLPGEHYNLIYFKESILLTALTYYPYIQLGIVALFILVSYLAFSSSRKAEQNQFFVGMSRETAHQLGTPTSSLAGWIEILQQKHPEVTITRELALDVKRLEKVTERFSRIGSKPALARENIIELILHTIEYLKSRISSRVLIIPDFYSEKQIIVPVNSALFEWVIENVAKNAVDAMEGDGEITFRVAETENNVLIDISDTGKGIPKSAFKKIFSPGFTTKQRGWGLGLSLARRIIEEYHNGRIFVRHSEIGMGSCIRIVLKK